MIPCIRFVQVRNFKSLGQVHVDLQPMTVLVGPNGSGKSNFMEMLGFVQEALVDSIEMAIKNRGGIGAVRRRSLGHPNHIGIRLSLTIGEDCEADYAFEIAAKSKEQFVVAQERCTVRRFMDAGQEHAYEIRNGEFTKPIPGILPRIQPDRLALYAASATEEFRPVYDFLTSMRFYAINPARLREMQEPDTGEVLRRDGSNAAAVLKRIQDEHPARVEEICEVLGRIVPGIERVRYRAMGLKETLLFKQDVGARLPWTFRALNMSDGTLRSLGLLLALHQPGRSTVMGVEELEAALHPAASKTIMKALLGASSKRQILVTTHSPELLEIKDIEASQIRAVWMKDGSTFVHPVDPASRKAIAERLSTPGELSSHDRLGPDPAGAQPDEQQLDLFGAPAFSDRS